MTPYEAANENLEKMIEWYQANTGSRNEATTRLQMIDRIFFECLGWEKDNAKLEEQQDGEYADYTFSAPRPLLIVEAKREGNYFELPTGDESIKRSLTTLVKDFQNVGAAVDQVAGYCQKRGVPVAVLCNGHQLVAFVAVRMDGIGPLKGHAFVFDSLQRIKENFLLFWNLLSQPGTEEQNLVRELMGEKRPTLPPKLSDTITNYPGLKNRNMLQTDLQILSELVIGDVAKHRDLEKQFLEECYCASGALSQYALVSKEILEARYEALFGVNKVGPITTPATTKEGMISPDILAESISKRPILLVGDIGSGKTIFIRHLIKSAASSVFDDAISLYIDLGSSATIADNLPSVISGEMTRQLREDYSIDIEERNFVHGIYHQDIERLKHGIYADLVKNCDV